MLLASIKLLYWALNDGNDGMMACASHLARSEVKSRVLRISKVFERPSRSTCSLERARATNTKPRRFAASTRATSSGDGPCRDAGGYEQPALGEQTPCTPFCIAMSHKDHAATSSWLKRQSADLLRSEYSA